MILILMITSEEKIMQSFFDHSKLESTIQEFFYNALVSRLLEQPNVTKSNIEKCMIDNIIMLIRDILDASKKCNGILIPPNIVMSLDICPEKYRPFFESLLLLKRVEPTHDQLLAIAKNVMQLDSFKMIDPALFVLEATRQVEPDLTQLHNHMVITPESIRSSFYNEMVTQTLEALQKGWITYENILDQDSVIYLALPALTILEAICQSDGQGIQLMNGVLTRQNCPQVEYFPALTDLIFSVKDNIKKLSDPELAIVQHVLFEKDMPQTLQARKTPELMSSIAVIKKMAIEISRKQMFHKTMKTVLEFCCDSLEPEKKNANRM